MIYSSGHKLVIIRAYYEHLYPPCVLFMLQVCPDNAHLWTSSDLIKVPSFLHYFVMMHRYCTHFWGITGHHLCSIQKFSYSYCSISELLSLCWSFYGHITQLNLLLGLFFFQLGFLLLPPSISDISYTKAIVLCTNILFEQANIHFVGLNAVIR